MGHSKVIFKVLLPYVAKFHLLDRELMQQVNSNYHLDHTFCTVTMTMSELESIPTDQATRSHEFDIREVLTHTDRYGFHG